MKKLFIFFIVIINAIFSIFVSNAYEINNHVYGRFSIGIGWTVQNIIVYNQGNKYTDNDLKKHINNALLIGMGNNFYFNIDRLIHPFIGMESYGRILLQGESYKDIEVEKTKYQQKYKELFMAHVKIGSKFNIKNTLSISPYFFTGFNISMLQMSIDKPVLLTNNKYYANLSIGVALEVLLYNRFIFGIEYRFSKMNHKYTYQLNNHNLGLKFSVELF